MLCCFSKSNGKFVASERQVEKRGKLGKNRNPFRYIYGRPESTDTFN